MSGLYEPAEWLDEGEREEDGEEGGWLGRPEGRDDDWGRGMGIILDIFIELLNERGSIQITLTVYPYVRYDRGLAESLSLQRAFACCFIIQCWAD